MHDLDSAPRVDRGAIEVRGHDHRDELHGRREGGTKRLQVSERHSPMLDSVARELLPGQKIAVVLLVGRHDHVTRGERKGMSDEIDGVRRVLGEDDLLDATGVQEPAGGFPRQRHLLVDPASEAVQAPLAAGRVLGVVGRHRVDHRLRPERHAGVVEIDETAVAQGWEVAPQPVRIEAHGRRASERPVHGAAELLRRGSDHRRSVDEEGRRPVDPRPSRRPRNRAARALASPGPRGNARTPPRPRPAPGPAR